MFTTRLDYTKHDNLLCFYNEKEEDIMLFRTDSLYHIIFDNVDDNKIK